MFGQYLTRHAKDELMDWLEKRGANLYQYSSPAPQPPLLPLWR